MPQPKAINPFYTLLVVVGVVFAITACAYGVMTVRGLDPHRVGEGGLVSLMDRHGMTIMIVEIALLAVLTVAAIGTDEFWTRRAQGIGKAHRDSDGDSSSASGQRGRNA
jgi:hypothetical protein